MTEPGDSLRERPEGAPAHDAGLSSLAAELQRRKVMRVAVTYFVVGLGILEAADIILPELFVPAVVNRWIVALVLLGFPVAISLAWAFDVSRRGIRREVAADDDPRPASRPRWMHRSAVPILLGGAILLVWRPWRDADPLAALVEPGFSDSVAVLPVENRTGVEENDHVAAAVTWEIVRHLREDGRIKVTDPYSVTRMFEAGATDQEIVRELGVEKLVRSDLFRDGDGLRLDVLATEGATGTVLWQARHEGGEASGHAAAVEIAASFGADYSRRTPALTSQGYAAPGHAAHSSGHEAVLEGMRMLGRRTFEGIRRARELFQVAVESAPEDAEALASLSKAHALSLAYRYRGDPEGYRAAGQALALANRAIERNPDLAAGYSARGYIASRASAPLRTVAEDCRKALDLDPNAADGLSWCTRPLKQLGWTNEALENAEKAISLDPRNAGRRLALAYDAISLRRYDDAVEQARAARALAPELMLPRVLEARALVLDGRAPDCLSLDLGPHAATRALCLHETGRTGEARTLVDSVAMVVAEGGIIDSVFTDVTRAEDLAVYHGWTGDPQLALSWVRLAYDLSPSGVEPRTIESALFDPVRSDREFRDGLEEIRRSIWERVVAEAGRAVSGTG